MHKVVRKLNVVAYRPLSISSTEFGEIAILEGSLECSCGKVVTVDNVDAVTVQGWVELHEGTERPASGRMTVRKLSRDELLARRAQGAKRRGSLNAGVNDMSEASTRWTRQWELEEGGYAHVEHSSESSTEGVRGAHGRQVLQHTSGRSRNW